MSTGGWFFFFEVLKVVDGFFFKRLYFSLLHRVAHENIETCVLRRDLPINSPVAGNSKFIDQENAGFERDASIYRKIFSTPSKQY